MAQKDLILLGGSALIDGQDGFDQVATRVGFFAPVGFGFDSRVRSVVLVDGLVFGLFGQEFEIDLGGCSVIVRRRGVRPATHSFEGIKFVRPVVWFEQAKVLVVEGSGGNVESMLVACSVEPPVRTKFVDDDSVCILAAQ